MAKNFTDILQGYQIFRKKYAHSDKAVMQYLHDNGQQPKIMVVACCDSRVDPALILQCDPGDLFVVRNVANIVPPFEEDEAHHGTSAALEFGIRILEVENLIILGHSKCGGVQNLLNSESPSQNDFISNWVSLIKSDNLNSQNPDEYAKLALHKSLDNCMTFPWIRDKVNQKKLSIHLWFFDIKTGQIFTYSDSEKIYKPLAPAI